MTDLADVTDEVLRQMGVAVEILITPPVVAEQMQALLPHGMVKESLIQLRFQTGKRHGILNLQIFIKIILQAEEEEVIHTHSLHKILLLLHPIQLHGAETVVIMLEVTEDVRSI